MNERSISQRASSRMTQRLDALLELARVSREHPPEAVLQTVVEIIERVVGFTVAAVNIYRPAWDDYEVVLVHGSEKAREALMGTVNTREGWLQECLHPSHEAVPGAFFLSYEDHISWEHMTATVVPDPVTVSTGPNAWHPEDALMVPLQASDGTPLGVLSLDAPSSGERPTNDDLEMLVAVANHASLALFGAQDAATAERHHQELADLLEVFSRLAAQTTESDVLEQVCKSVVPGLGFEAIGVYLTDGDVLHLRASCGLADGPLVELAVLEPLLERYCEHGGALVKRADLMSRGVSSKRNGRGPRAWHDDRLIVPMRQGDGAIIGALVFDNPVDRLRPDAQRRQTLRLLADHTVAALESIARQRRLEYLASHDPLTGIRNRRDLLTLIDALAAGREGVSVLICDLDYFKQVNDRFGHTIGDRVLERFGSMLRQHARSEDVPVRIGGEEFCVVLPRVDTHGAAVAAERLRQATAKTMADLVPGLTVSIGTATSLPGSADAAQLLQAADRALYAAKAAGRNRVRSSETTDASLDYEPVRGETPC